MRIAVLGNSGSGKSIFSAWLAPRLGVPLLHVDQVLWMPGWQARAEPEVTAVLRAFQAQPRWIVDGVGTRRQVFERLARADLRILIDPPLEACRRNALLRADRQPADDSFIGQGLRWADVRAEQLALIDLMEREWMPGLRRQAAAESGWVRYASFEAAYADLRWPQSPR